jgi:hypothetical protein
MMRAFHVKAGCRAALGASPNGRPSPTAAKQKRTLIVTAKRADFKDKKERGRPARVIQSLKTPIHALN